MNFEYKITRHRDTGHVIRRGQWQSGGNRCRKVNKRYECYEFMIPVKILLMKTRNAFKILLKSLKYASGFSLSSRRRTQIECIKWLLSKIKASSSLKGKGTQALKCHLGRCDRQRSATCSSIPWEAEVTSDISFSWASVTLLWFYFQKLNSPIWFFIT